MAKSQYEYVKFQYELEDKLLPNTFIVVRVDGRGFHKFSDAHSFEKPNDVRALNLMDHAAAAVMREFPDVVLAFGESDEYSFLFRRCTSVYSRRRSKINSSVASVFTSNYVYNWARFLPDTPLKYAPSFDSRVVLYPSIKEVRDYFAWRQADTHINNLYNTSFWALVKGGATTREANDTLQGTDSKDKNEILFSRFGINYNNIEPMYRKGSILVRVDPLARSEPSSTAAERSAPARADGIVEDSSALPATMAESVASDAGARARAIAKKEAKKRAFDGTSGEIAVLHEDIIKDAFWKARPWLLT